MLKHDEAQALFVQMVDGELPASQETAFRFHLESCAECKQGFEKYSRTVKLLRSVKRERAPADFSKQVLKRVRSRRRKSVLRGARLLEYVSTPIGAAVPIVLVVAMIIVVILLFLRQ